MCRLKDNVLVQIFQTLFALVKTGNRKLTHTNIFVRNSSTKFPSGTSDTKRLVCYT